MRDIKLQENGDVELNGDIVYIESTEQHKGDILQASKGDYINAPLMGVNAIDYLLDEKPHEFLREVTRQMTADGIKVKEVSFDVENNLIIDGKYES
ncbi:MAG: hypothetical protein RRZ64_08525 [Rikenellaceae bacterium]